MLLSVEKKHPTPEITVVEIKGRITMGRECQQVEWTVDDLLKNNETKVVFDLSGVAHVDSTGIGIIVMSAGKLKRAGGELRVAGTTGWVDQVLKLTRVNTIVPFYADTATAVGSFAGANAAGKS